MKVLNVKTNPKISEIESNSNTLEVNVRAVEPCSKLAFINTLCGISPTDIVHILTKNELPLSLMTTLNSIKLPKVLPKEIKVYFKLFDFKKDPYYEEELLSFEILLTL